MSETHDPIAFLARRMVAGSCVMHERLVYDSTGKTLQYREDSPLWQTHDRMAKEATRGAEAMRWVLELIDRETGAAYVPGDLTRDDA